MRSPGPPAKSVAAALLGIAALALVAGRVTRRRRERQPCGTGARVGDVVRGSDRWKVGTVERVVEATGTAPAYLLVRRRGGVMDRVLEAVQHRRLRRSGFRRRIYVPADAVVRRAGGDLFIGVPRIVVRKMPWRHPPTHAAREVKYGPRPAEVEKLYGTISPSLHEPPHRPAGRGSPPHTALPGMQTRPGDADHRESGQTYLARGSAGLAYPRGQTALLVVDPVNDFLSEGGAAWELTRATVRKHDVIANLKRAIEGARARGIPVLFGPMAYTEADYRTHQLHHRSGINRVQFERKLFLAGSWGADFHPELRPSPGEIVLLPHKGIDVFMTDLQAHLERLGITHLAIAGMTANLCVESTGRHAMEKGYDVTFLFDAIGADSHPSWVAAVHLNYPLIGNAVIRVDEFLSAAGA